MAGIMYTEIKYCRACDAPLGKPFLDLGDSPLANAYEKVDESSSLYPLAVVYCTKCYLVQLTYNIDPDVMFTDYAYFSSFSTTFLHHIGRTVENLAKRFSIDKETKVLEIASNDGYLLQYMKRYTNRITGVDPAKNIAAEANKKGIPTIAEFFSKDFAISLNQEFDIIIGNNVLAHVPNINDFLAGVKICLAEEGVATFEFPYLSSLLKHVEFDTIYHEHIFYYSLIALKNLFALHDMEIFDIRYSQIHGGSVRIFVQHFHDINLIDSSVSVFEFMERMDGLDNDLIYKNFSTQVDTIKRDLWHMINSGILHQGKTLAAYGAPAKGNTLLNYCGIDANTIDFTVDISPHKQGLFLPGSHIPIYHPDELLRRMPDYCLILPWNFKEEIMQQQAEYLNREGKFIIPIPFPRVIGEL